MKIRVECYAGYRGEEEPRAFKLGERALPSSKSSTAGDAERVLRSAPVPVLLVRAEEKRKRTTRKRRRAKA